MENLELFKKYYLKEKEELLNVINKFNDKIILEKDKTLNENLNIFSKLNSNGKLIRGILINLGYSFFYQKNKKYSNNLALAYEIFQTSILMHDDIIDNDNKRRGNDTIHYANYNKYKKYSENDEELKNISSSIGICIGDYGLYLANKVISSSYIDDKNLGKVLNYFNDIVLKTIKGELLDVVAPFETKYEITSNEDLEKRIMEIYKLKTAYYTIVGPLCLGMILAGATEDKLTDITKYAEKIGIAFQIQDDILGIYSDDMGKVVGSDIKEFKQTVLYSYVLKTKYKEEILKYYGKNKITNEEIQNVRDLFKESGAYDYAYNYMNELYDEGLNILNDISWLDEKNKNILCGFVSYLRKRNK